MEILSSLIKDPSENVIGKDAWDIPVVECPKFKKNQNPNRWAKCEECGRECLTDANGTFYHKLSCSKSNGIGYDEERGICKTGKDKCMCSACRRPNKRGDK